MKAFQCVNIKYLICILVVIAVIILVIPYCRAEYYTAEYGSVFAARGSDIGYEMPNCRYKVIKLDDGAATVYYVSEDH